MSVINIYCINGMTLCKFLGYVHIIRTADMIALLQKRS